MQGGARRRGTVAEPRTPPGGCGPAPRDVCRRVRGSGDRSSTFLGLRAQAGDRLPDQARDVHLRHAHDVPDLGLREVLLEAQAQDLALAIGEHPHQPLDGGGVLGQLEAVVLAAERVGEVALLVLLVAGAVERDGAVRAGGLARLQHLLLRGADPLRDLARGGGAAELAAHVLADAVDLDRELLQVARYADGPALVTEMTLELAEDGRDRERRERCLSCGVEALDRLQQSQRGDLDQVVERLSGALVAAGELPRERQEALDERLARGWVVIVVIALQQAAILAGARLAFGRPGICSGLALALLGSILDGRHAPLPAST